MNISPQFPFISDTLFTPYLGHFTLVRGHLLPQPLGPLEHNMPCMNPWFILSDSSLSPCLQSSIRERGEMTNCFPWIRLYDTMPDASFWHNNSRWHFVRFQKSLLHLSTTSPGRKTADINLPANTIVSQWTTWRLIWAIRLLRAVDDLERAHSDTRTH